MSVSLQHQVTPQQNMRNSTNQTKSLSGTAPLARCRFANSDLLYYKGVGGTVYLASLSHMGLTFLIPYPLNYPNLSHYLERNPTTGGSFSSLHKSNIEEKLYVPHCSGRSRAHTMWWITSQKAQTSQNFSLISFPLYYIYTPEQTSTCMEFPTISSQRNPL